MSAPMDASLVYDGGRLLIRGVEFSPPYAKWDGVLGAYTCEAIHYSEVKNYLLSRGVRLSERVFEPLEFRPFTSKYALRDYQLRAYDAWLAAERRGIIVLPTGAGKTAVAIHAISETSVPALVVVPTIDLLKQWGGQLEAQGAEVGYLGGGMNSVAGVTVSTYDSAAIRAGELGNRFRLLVFDEVHHLPAQVYAKIARLSAAEYRLGLTATYEREDGLHTLLPYLVGRVVYSSTHSELSGRYLSEYSTEVVRVSLGGEEKAKYDELMDKYRGILRKHNFRIRSQRDFQRLIFLSGSNRELREALLSRNEAQKIAFNSSGKIRVLRGLLERFRGERIIVFTQHNELVERISREFLIPSITHETPKDEREEVLGRFREGVYTCVVTSKVLDEGVDVPDASVGIILSGTGSRREYVQRLGRILRKRDGKVAQLVEVVSGGTMEVNTSYRRRRV
ncbi:MAG: DEAD/DEAH box helicase family protein [Thermoprotei archaeon]